MKKEATEQYYLIETGHSNEGHILFWAKDAHGYTIDIDKAGLYNHDFVKGSYLGHSKDTLAIEKSKFESIMKTAKVVYNIYDFHDMIMKVKK